MWVQLRALLRDRDVDPDAAIVADMIPDGPEVIDSVVDVLQRLLDLAQPVEQPGFVSASRSSVLITSSTSCWA